MGVLCKGRNRQLDRLVEIKVLPVLKRKDAGAVARFAHEIKTLGRLLHQNIVADLDADE